jgi:hypothetical protein
MINATTPTIQAPVTRGDITAQFRHLYEQSVLFWEAFDTATFVAPYGTAWSPADHIRHLNRSMRALTRGLSLPKWKLWLRFGRTRRASRTYLQVRDTYLSGLPSFTGRPNPYPPRPVEIDNAEEWRHEVMHEHDVALQNLLHAIEGWQERTLDRYQLPHPLLGKLTVREMLFFVLYHNWHHVNVVARRG